MYLCLIILVSLLYLNMYFFCFIYYFNTTSQHFYTSCISCFLHSSLSFNYFGSHSFVLYKTFQVNLDFNPDRDGIGAPYASSCLGRLVG